MPRHMLKHPRPGKLRRLVERWRAVFDRLVRAHAICDRTLSEPAVHELRLAARRALPVLALMAIHWPDDPRIAGAYRSVKATLRALGPLRDAQLRVLRCGSSARTTSLRPIARAEVRRLAPVARRALAAIPLALPADLLSGSAAMVGADIWKASGKRFGDLAVTNRKRYVRRERNVVKGDTELQHRARVALKRYRHLLITLDPVVRVRARHWVERLKARQDRWGEAHDRHLFDQWVAAQGSVGEAKPR
ncbi:MAG: CHAD domain-containing protein [Flavobacteriales bacterium]|nr:CHAD domain-containing protein [Flavobacteriales bacterium]MCB9182248.1 CHAD domain-containing protein [Flavobacteriales bacterium]